MGVVINVNTGYGFIIKNTKENKLNEEEIAKSFASGSFYPESFDGLDNMFSDHYNCTVDVFSDCYDDSKDWYICIDCERVMCTEWYEGEQTGLSEELPTPLSGKRSKNPCINELHRFFKKMFGDRVSNIGNYSFLYFS